MCEECDRRHDRLTREIEDPLMEAVSARFEAHAAAVIDDAGVHAADVDALRARQACAVTFGLPLLELEAAVAKLAYVAADGMARGVDVFATMESSAMQGMLVGWFLRDEQLKAEREAAAGA